MSLQFPRVERGLRLWRASVCLIASWSLAGCATIQTKTSYYKGNTPDLQPADLARFAAQQDAIVATLEAMAGTPGLQNGSDWRPVVDAGMHYADVRCSRFMDALFWFNRVRETSSHQIQYTGAATSALLALVGAAKDLIGIAPLGFGLLDQTVNNVGQGLLYNLDPGIVSGLVGRQQAAYRQAIKDTRYTNRGAALQTIQQYAVLCLPVSIEGEVNRAITNSEFKATSYRLPPPGGRTPGTPATPGTATTPPGDTNVVPVIEQAQPESHE